MQENAIVFLYFDCIRVSSRLSAEFYLCRVNNSNETKILKEYFHISQSHLDDLKKAAMLQNNVLTYLEELEDDELYQYCMLIKGTQLKHLLEERINGLTEEKQAVVRCALAQTETNEIKKTIDLDAVLECVHSFGQSKKIERNEKEDAMLSFNIKKAIMGLTGTQICEEIIECTEFNDKEIFLNELVDKRSLCILWKDEKGNLFGIYIQDEIVSELPLGFDNYLVWVKGKDSEIKVSLLNQKCGIEAKINFVEDDNWFRIKGNNGFEMVLCLNGTNNCQITNFNSSFYVNSDHPICCMSSFKISNLYLLYLHH